MGDFADMLIEQGMMEMLDGERDNELDFHDPCGYSAPKKKLLPHCRYCGQRGMNWVNTAEEGLPPVWRLFEANKTPHVCENVRCKYCAEAGLRWKQLSSGWRLHDANGALHECLDKEPD